MPFDVPNGWCWCRLSDVGEIVTGNTPSKEHSEYYGGEIPFFKPTDLEQGINTIYASDMLTDLGYGISRKLTEGSILVTCIGATIGKTGVIRKHGTCNQQINAIIPNKSVISEYCYYSIISGYFQSEIKDNANATTLPILNKRSFSELLFPLPPLAEQQRIVTEIERWFDVIDALEANEGDLQKTIEQTKKKILDLAIRGKLVPQDPNDEPASELLKRLGVSSDNRPYENVPTSWAFTNLGSVFQHNTGKALNKSASQEGTLMPYITTSNVYWDCFELDNVKQMCFKDSEIDKCTVKKGDLLVCEGGDIGRSAIWPFDYTICIQNHIHRLRPKFDVSVKFYYFVLMLYKSQNSIEGKGIGMLGLSSGQLDKLMVPVPPVNEQKCIVDKVEELFSQLDTIAKALE